MVARRERTFLFAAVAGAVALGIAASGATAGARDNSPIKIGSITILSGPVSVIGLDTVRGAQLEADYINAHGGVLGRTIELISMDDANTPSLALESATKLIQDEHVVGLLGPTNSVSALAIQKLVDQAKVPEALYTSGANEVTASGSLYVFRTVPALDYGYDALATYLFKSRHLRKIAYIGWNLAAGTTALNGLKVAAQQNSGVQIVSSQQLPLTTQDFLGAIAQAKASNPDVVIIGAPMPFAGVVAKQIRDSGWNVPIGEHGGFVTHDFGAFLGSNADGIVMADNGHWRSATTRKMGRAFINAFHAKYHRPPNANELVGADALGALVAGIKKARSTDGDKIQQALHSLSYNGLRLAAQWDKAGNLRHFPIPVVVWKSQGKALDMLSPNVFPIIGKKK